MTGGQTPQREARAVWMHVALQPLLMPIGRSR